MVQLGVLLDDVACGGQERLVSALYQVNDRGSEEVLRSYTQLLRLEREMLGLGISEAHGQARHDMILAPRALPTNPLCFRANDQSAGPACPGKPESAQGAGTTLSSTHLGSSSPGRKTTHTVASSAPPLTSATARSLARRVARTSGFFGSFP